MSDHYELLLREKMIWPPLAAVICGESYCSDLLNEDLIHDKISNKCTSNTFSDDLEFYYDAFNEFESQFLKSKNKMENVMKLHCIYLEIYHRLLLVANIPMRTVRRYVLDHIVMILKTLKDVNFLMSGQLAHNEDYCCTLRKFIHPTLTGRFPRSKFVPFSYDKSSQLYVCSFRGLIYLRHELVLNDVSPSVGEALTNLDGRRNAIRELVQVWALDLVDMLETLQMGIETKICVGFQQSDSGSLYNYTLNKPSNGRFDFKISAQTLKVAINLDYEKINHNIRNVSVPEAFGCEVASEVLRDHTYMVKVNRLVETKLCKYQESAVDLYFTEMIAKRNKLLNDIDNHSEEADYW